MHDNEMHDNDNDKVWTFNEVLNDKKKLVKEIWYGFCIYVEI